MSSSIQIAVVGSGYVGLVAAVCFAEMGHQVICVDNDQRKVDALRAGDTLIHEEHLPELLGRYRNGKIKFMTDLSEATRECDAIFIAVGTPQSEKGDADLSYVEAVACEIARSLTKYTVIVEKEHGTGLYERVDPAGDGAERGSRGICSTWYRTRSFYVREPLWRTFCIPTGLS